jgi:hypothetical protein
VAAGRSVRDTTVWVVNASTVVSDTDVAKMTAAVDGQVRQHLAPAWGLVAPTVRFAPDPPKAGRIVTVLDTLDDVDALGWHTDEAGDRIYGVVGAKVVLDHGATATSGAYAVSTILSHEVCELVVDPFCSGWSDTGRGFLVACEVADPVQSDYYDLAGISVSNFVNPTWFDPNGTGPFDHMNTTRKPFTLARGGYWVQMADGKTTQRFAEGFPGFLMVNKSHAVSRTQRISRGHPGAAR